MCNLKDLLCAQMEENTKYDLLMWKMVVFKCPCNYRYRLKKIDERN